MKGESHARSRKSAAMPLSAGRFPPCCSERPFRWRHRNMLTPESDKRRCHSEKRSRPSSPRRRAPAAHSRLLPHQVRATCKKTELAKKQRKMYLPQMLRRPSFSKQAAGPASRLFRRMSPGVRRKRRGILSAAQTHPACFMMHPQPFRQKVPPRFPQQTRTVRLPFPAFHRHSL